MRLFAFLLGLALVGPAWANPCAVIIGDWLSDAAPDAFTSDSWKAVEKAEERFKNGLKMAYTWSVVPLDKRNKLQFSLLQHLLPGEKGNLTYSALVWEPALDSQVRHNGWNVLAKPDGADCRLTVYRLVTSTGEPRWARVNRHLARLGVPPNTFEDGALRYSNKNLWQRNGFGGWQPFVFDAIASPVQEGKLLYFLGELWRKRTMPDWGDIRRQAELLDAL